MYGPHYVVPERTLADFPFLHSQEDWRVCQVLRNLAVHYIPHRVKDKPHVFWEYYPGSPPKLGEVDRGVYVSGAMGE